MHYGDFLFAENKIGFPVEGLMAPTSGNAVQLEYGAQLKLRAVVSRRADGRHHSRTFGF